MAGAAAVVGDVRGLGLQDESVGGMIATAVASGARRTGTAAAAARERCAVKSTLTTAFVTIKMDVLDRRLGCARLRCQFAKGNGLLDFFWAYLRYRIGFHCFLARAVGAAAATCKCCKLTCGVTFVRLACVPTPSLPAPTYLPVLPLHADAIAPTT